MEAVVAAEPVWATLLAANYRFLSAIFELSVPESRVQLPEGFAPIDSDRIRRH